MRGAKLLMLLGLVLLAVVARQLLPDVDADPGEPFFPAAARSVPADDSIVEWIPDPDVRDPFVPLVLPEAPTTTIEIDQSIPGGDPS